MVKATIQVQCREGVWIDEKVGDFEYTLEDYREKILRLKEVLGRAHLE